jgi:hypothetical protein
MRLMNWAEREKGSLKRKCTAAIILEMLLLFFVSALNLDFVIGELQPNLVDCEIYYSCAESSIQIMLIFDSEEKITSASVFFPGPDLSCKLKILEGKGVYYATGTIWAGELGNGTYTAQVVVTIEQRTEISLDLKFEVNCGSGQDWVQGIRPLAQTSLNNLEKEIELSRDTIEKAQNHGLDISKEVLDSFSMAERLHEWASNMLLGRNPVAANCLALDGIKLLENSEELQYLKKRISLPNLTVELYSNKDEYYVGEEVVFDFSVKNDGNSECTAYYKITYDGRVEDGEVDLMPGQVERKSTEARSFWQSGTYLVHLKVECEGCEEITLADNEEIKKIVIVSKLEISVPSETTVPPEQESWFRRVILRVESSTIIKLLLILSAISGAGGLLIGAVRYLKGRKEATS